MEDKVIERWRHRILAREVIYLPPIIERAAAFLEAARNEQGTWGPFKGLPLDLHASALAVQALHACDPKRYDHVIQDAMLPLRSYVLQTHAEFGVQETSDALTLQLDFGAKANGTDDLKQLLVRRLQDLKRGFGWGFPEPSISATAEVLLALQAKSISETGAIDLILRGVLGLQHSEDGGWPITPGSKSTLLSSALMLRVLSQTRAVKYEKSRTACLKYLCTHLNEKGWQSFREPATDLFVACKVLLAIACAPEGPYEIVLQGVEFLCEEVSQEGAWGAGKAGISSVELTSLCLLALTSAGENKFTTSRLATEALTVAAGSVTELVKEKEQLASDIQGRVRQEIGNILRERNKLDDQVKQLEGEKRQRVAELAEAGKSLHELKNRLSQLDSLRERSDEFFLHHNSRLPAYVLISDWRMLVNALSKSWPYLLSSVLLPFTAWILVARLQALYAWLVPPILIAGLFLMLSLIVIITRRTADTLLIQQRLAFDREAFLRATREPDLYFVYEEMSSILAEWPPSKREDFMFRLMRESVRIGPDEMEAYSSYLSRRYGDDELQKRRLSHMMTLYLNLPPRAREDVASRLREVPWPLRKA